MSNPLPGSSIELTRVGNDELLVLPMPARSVINYLMAAFLLAWMGGWAMGFRSAATQLATGEGSAFLMFWLAGWTVGGLFAAWMLFSLLRPSKPETLLLRRDSARYDSGMAPHQVSFSVGGQRDFWKQVFRRRQVRELDAGMLRTLSLRETEGGNRLTLDHGVERLDLATLATEVEREWLHAFLSDRYR